ncbi:hypothetical protein KRP22_014247 [Phytophthora ramorum]|nr:hypothetical protein KRP22_9153 [Phytophthora ramorum]
MVKYATEDVAPTPKQDTLVINAEADKIENGYANMPNTPKATDFMPILAEKRTGMYRFAVQSVHLRECFAEFLAIGSTQLSKLELRTRNSMKKSVLDGKKRCYKRMALTLAGED